MCDFDSTEWNLSQLLAWVALRDRSAVDALGRHPGIHAVPWIEMAPSPALTLDAAERQIRQHLLDGALPCSSAQGAIPLDRWSTLLLLFSRSAVTDTGTGQVWSSVLVPRDRVLLLWPPQVAPVPCPDSDLMRSLVIGSGQASTRAGFRA